VGEIWISMALSESIMSCLLAFSSKHFSPGSIQFPIGNFHSSRPTVSDAFLPTLLQPGFHSSMLVVLSS
jgi:hypothetical protein